MSSSLLTDPSLNLLSLARSFELLSAGDINFATLPNNGPQLIYPDGVETSIVQVDYAAIPSFIRTIIGERHPDLSTIKAAAPSTVTVDVLNGAERLPPGHAQRRTSCKQARLQDRRRRLDAEPDHRDGHRVPGRARGRRRRRSPRW